MQPTAALAVSIGRLGARYPRNRRSRSTSSDSRQSLGRPGTGPEMSHITLTVPDMNEPPGLHNMTIRVAKEAGHHCDPAAFAAAASRAAAGRNASILSAHTAEEIICVVSVPAATGPEAAAVTLAVVAGALKAGDLLPSPSR